jgi:hypothetical protein
VPRWTIELNVIINTSRRLTIQPAASHPVIVQQCLLIVQRELKLVTGRSAAGPVPVRSTRPSALCKRGMSSQSTKWRGNRVRYLVAVLMIVLFTETAITGWDCWCASRRVTTGFCCLFKSPSSRERSSMHESTLSSEMCQTVKRTQQQLSAIQFSVTCASHDG